MYEDKVTLEVGTRNLKTSYRTVVMIGLSWQLSSPPNIILSARSFCSEAPCMLRHLMRILSTCTRVILFLCRRLSFPAFPQLFGRSQKSFLPRFSSPAGNLHDMNHTTEKNQYDSMPFTLIKESFFFYWSGWGGLPIRYPKGSVCAYVCT